MNRAVFTHWRGVAKRGGCFQWRRVCLSVCLFVCAHDIFRTIKRMIKLVKLGG